MEVTAKGRILVLGLGNELVGDDGVGIHLLRELRALSWGDELTFEESAAGGIALLELIAGCEKLLLLDCIIAKEENPGKVKVLSQEDLAVSRHAGSIHDLSVAEVWELGERMGMPMPAVTAVVISVELRWVIGEELSPGAKEALPIAIEKSLAVLAEWGVKPK